MARRFPNDAAKNDGWYGATGRFRLIFVITAPFGITFVVVLVMRSTMLVAAVLFSETLDADEDDEAP